MCTSIAYSPPLKLTFALLSVTLLINSAAGEISITLTTDREPCIEVEGIPAETSASLTDEKLSRDEWQRVLAIFVDRNGHRQPLPVLGDYRVDGNRIVFMPQFPLKPGLAYRAVFDANSVPGVGSKANDSRVETTLLIPDQPRGKPAIVEAVYPSGDALPENLLKFYVHFSAPMSRGGSYRHIRLLDAKGADVDYPFLELAEELWDPSGRRLTLLLDPGRVKQELKPNKEVGRALTQGNVYTLLIADSWPDAAGGRLGGEHRKTFRVDEADVGQPDPQRWKLLLPDAGTRKPLTVTLDEPLDHALLQHAIEVSGPTKTIVDGRVDISDHETSWHFCPETPWTAGNYQLIVDATLEDRAGNSIGRPFEVDLRSDRRAEVTECIVPFAISNGSAAPFVLQPTDRRR